MCAPSQGIDGIHLLLSASLRLFAFMLFDIIKTHSR